MNRNKNFILMVLVAINSLFAIPAVARNTSNLCSGLFLSIKPELLAALKIDPQKVRSDSPINEPLGLMTMKVVGFLDGKHSSSKQPIFISQNLLGELSAIANSKLNPGIRLPHELESLVSKGSELRLYFSGGDRRVRLSVRRLESGEWSFGDTALDEQTVSDSYFNQRVQSKYSPMEIKTIEDSYSHKIPPGERLRKHLTSIRSSLLVAQAKIEFPKMFQVWARAIPEGISRADVIELLAYNEGLSYQLSKGFVRGSLPKLSAAEAKKLAAIKFLVGNQLVFYSVNAGAAGIRMGIFPQSSEKPVKPLETGYDYGSLLFQALEAEGAKYETIDGVGKWRWNWE